MGIPAVKNRIVQAAMKVIESIFEAQFLRRSKAFPTPIRSPRVCTKRQGAH
jgi:hypothetical protein